MSNYQPDVNRKSSIICTNCGQDSAPGSQFCGICGSNLKMTPPTILVDIPTQVNTYQPSTVQNYPPNYVGQGYIVQPSQFQAAPKVQITPSTTIRVSIGVVLISWSMVMGLFGLFLVLLLPEFFLMYAVFISIPGIVGYKLLIAHMTPGDAIKSTVGFAIALFIIYWVFVAVFFLFAGLFFNQFY